jgi:hypothetical protein
MPKSLVRRNNEKKVPSIRAAAQIFRTFDIVFGLAFPRLP